MPISNQPPHVDMLRSPLSRARGLGSARAGSKHWWAQRVTAAALVPLTLWFIWSILRLTDGTRDDVADWLSSPLVMAMMLSLIAATFHHLQLGLQVIIEDYVHQESLKLPAVLAMKGVCILLGLVCAVCVLALGLSS